MTNITTHRRCETCEWHKTFAISDDENGSNLQVIHCVNVKVPERFSRFTQDKDFGCSEWSGSIEYNRSRGLMTPAVSNALVDACKSFIMAQEAQIEQWGMDSGDYKAMLQVHADAIRDALKQQGVEV